MMIPPSSHFRDTFFLPYLRHYPPTTAIQESRRVQERALEYAHFKRFATETS